MRFGERDEIWANFILTKNHAITLFNEKDFNINENPLNFNKRTKEHKF